jgi:RecA-family ATPase
MALTPIDGGAPKRARVLHPFEIISPASWGRGDPPPYDWIVEGCFLAGTVAMLSGDGGLGKSLLMQQLCTAAAVGERWLGLATRRCKCFAMFCEDDSAELHRRQARINQHYGCDSGDLEDVLYTARAGLENLLLEFRRNDDKGVRTSVFEQLCHAVRDFGAQIIVIDTVADTFGGNEIMRSHVRRFINALRALAMEMHGVVILTSHPSLTGLNSGTGISGSTAWNNSVRSRLYLTRPKRRPEEEGEDVDDSNERVLRTMKNNSAAAGGRIPLRWEKGVFVRSDSGASAGLFDRLAMERDLVDGLRGLIRDGTLVPADKNARNGFANAIRAVSSCKQYSWAIVCAAQERLIESGTLERVEMGPPSKRRVYLRPSDMRYPGEATGETE